jgi:hypothetical protein
MTVVPRHWVRPATARAPSPSPPSPTGLLPEMFPRADVQPP